MAPSIHLGLLQLCVICCMALYAIVALNIVFKVIVNMDEDQAQQYAIVLLAAWLVLTIYIGLVVFARWSYAREHADKDFESDTNVYELKSMKVVV